MQKYRTKGEKVPDFVALDTEGRKVSLHGFLRDKPIVLYFYTSDLIPLCSAETRAFRDQYEQFSKPGVEVIGVSGDSPERHARFSTIHRLPFILLSDQDGGARRALGVRRSMMGMMPGRETFVIAEDGTLMHHFSGQFHIQMHVTVSLNILREAAKHRPSSPVT